VILFGLSMDYRVFILSRIREARDYGMSTGQAVAHGITSSAGAVTSAAIDTPVHPGRRRSESSTALSPSLVDATRHGTSTLPKSR